MTQPQTPFVEFLNASPRGDEIVPIVGDMLVDEPPPLGGRLKLSDAPG